MSYKAELQANNVDLQSILDTVNALPEAGGSGGGGEVVIDILPSLDLEPAYQLNMVNAYGVEMMADYSLTVGETYRVVWDTETYICVAQDVSGFIPGAVAVGNCAGLGLSGNNEPFIIGVANGGAMYISITDTEAGGEHSVRIYQKVEDLADGTYLQTEDGSLILAGDVGGSMEGVHTVTFMSEDGIVELFKRPVADGDDCADPVKRDLMDAPTKESTVEYNYSHVGWATTPNGAWDENALKAVAEDKTVYAAFAAVTRVYAVRFWDGETLLHTAQVAYGGSYSYEPTITKDGYFFGSWSPEPNNVTGDMDCYAQWKMDIDFATASWADIAEISAAGEAAQYFAVGDTKAIPVTYEDGTTDNITVAIAGFNHDTLADGSGKAGISIVATTVPDITAPWVKTYKSGNNHTYDTSDARTVLLSTVFNALPEELTAVIKNVSKKIDTTKNIGKNQTLKTITDPLWLLAMDEMGHIAPTSGTNLVPGGEYLSVLGTRYELFPAKDITHQYADMTPVTIGSTGKGCKNWTRHLYRQGSTAIMQSAQRYQVQGSGTVLVGERYAAATDNFGSNSTAITTAVHLRFGFCV